MTGPLHCAACDDYTCAGYTRPWTTTEPTPPLKPESIASPAQRRAALDAARAAVDEAKRRRTTLNASQPAPDTATHPSTPPTTHKPAERRTEG